MLRTSAVIVSIAGTPWGVAGIFTSRLGWAMRSCRWRAVAYGHAASAGRGVEPGLEVGPSESDEQPVYDVEVHATDQVGVVLGKRVERAVHQGQAIGVGP